MKHSTTLLLSCGVLTFGLFLFQAGFFDRPSIEEVTMEGSFYFFLAATNSKDIGGSVMRLLQGTKNAISQVASPEQMARPAQIYEAPEGSEALSAGLYLDDPMTDDHPRWGLGWAIQAESDQEANDLLTKVQAASSLEEPMRLVKIEGGIKILRSRIPWRSSITPAVAPFLHWERLYSIYQQGEYSSDNGRSDGHEGSVALEIYVTGPNDSFEYFDYIVLMGDTKSIFDGFDPPASATNATPQKVEVEINPVPADPIPADTDQVTNG